MGTGRQVLDERPWPWGQLFARDPRGWVLGSEEAAARWALLTGVLDRPETDPEAAQARAAVLADVGTRDLIGRLTDWEVGDRLSGHESPRFVPNLLGLLADMGLRAGDDRGIDHVLAQMLAHQDDEGRFLSFSAPRGQGSPVWSALLCDTHAIVEVLLRFGHGSDPRVRTGLDRMLADLTETAQGTAWPCRPDSLSGFRGPGRKGDFCPQVTLEALRCFSLLPSQDQPPQLLDAARVAIAAWRLRGTQKPYMFGHGKTFKTIKWPATWYRVHAMVDTLGRFPSLWRGPEADPADRRALAELAACLVAYNTDEDGRVVPHSTYRGFESFSFGQKVVPSAFATAQVLSALHRVDELAAEAAAVDVATLTSSKGGSGTAAPPPRGVRGQPV